MSSIVLPQVEEGSYMIKLRSMGKNWHQECKALLLVCTTLLFWGTEAVFIPECCVSIGGGMYTIRRSERPKEAIVFVEMHL